MKNKNEKNKNINNKKLTILIAIFIMLTLLLIIQRSFAISEVTGTSGTCTWKINTSGKMTIYPTSGSNCTLGIHTATRMPWYDYRENVLTVEVLSGVKANSASNYLFGDLPNATSIDISRLNTSGVTAMSGFFQYDKSLTTIDFTNFDTSSVETLVAFFRDCSSLESLDLSNFNTENVIRYNNMFWGCSSLKNLNLSSFQTTNAEIMGHMFYECSSLKTLDLSSFRINNIVYMDSMFSGCSSLEELDLSSFTTSNKPEFTMEKMFENCTSLKKLNLSNLNLTNVGDVTWEDGVGFSPAVDDAFKNIGSNTESGTELILNKTFNKTFDTDSNFSFPYNYYAKKTNNKLQDKLYSLSEMEIEVKGSNTPTTWVPAYSVTYNGNGGKVNDEDTFLKIYPTGTKIDTKNIKAYSEDKDLDKWTDKEDESSSSLIINANDISQLAYGSNYSQVGNNNNINLYAQYKQNSKYLVKYVTDKYGNLSKEQEEIELNGNPTVLSTPNLGYKTLMWKCDKPVKLTTGVTIIKGSPISNENFKKIMVDDNMTCNAIHKLDNTKSYNCN